MSFSQRGIFPSKKTVDTVNSDTVEHYVIVPTGDVESYITAPAKEIAVEFNDIIDIAKHDIAFLTTNNNNVSQTIFFTGYSGNSDDAPVSSQTLANLITDLAAKPLTSKISLHISGHGTPGSNGCVGMGFDDDKHFNFRLSAQALFDQLETAGFDQLKNHRMDIIFRCCNTAYVTLNPHKKADQQCAKPAPFVSSSSGKHR